MTLSLFDAPLIPGLRYCERMINEAEERELVAHLERSELSPFRFHGWTGKRRTGSFGWRYDFDDASFRPAEPIPAWLVRLREKAAEFASLSPTDFVHVLLARYDPGAAIGWHRDRPVFEAVVGVSIGAAATLRFRQRSSAGFRRASLPVAPRSAYLLSGEARHEWEHSIAAGAELRFSITFRTLSELGRRKASAQLETREALGDPAGGGQGA